MKKKLLSILLAFASILSLSGKKGDTVYDKINYEKLTEELKIKFRKKLQRDPEKDFNKEFVRTTNLEWKLINKYGMDGIKLVFEFRNSANYYELGDFPTDCPWALLNNKKMDELITGNFMVLKNKLPDLINIMEKRCRFIYAEKKDSTWHLHYFLQIKLYDGRDYYRVFTGGSPNSDPAINKNLTSFEWTIPQDLKDFYAVHDGFGEIYEAQFILNSSDISVMGEMMNPICTAQNTHPEGYSFNDLLEFFPDGAGNAQCFLRAPNGNNQTVDWDHEVWEISEPVNFFTFINEQMSGVDEE